MNFVLNYMRSFPRQFCAADCMKEPFYVTSRRNSCHSPPSITKVMNMHNLSLYIFTLWHQSTEVTLYNFLKMFYNMGIVCLGQLLKVNVKYINQQSKLSWLFLSINKMQVQSQDAPVVTRTACIQHFIGMSTICLQWKCFMWIPQLQFLVCTTCQAVGAINWKM